LLAGDERVTAADDSVIGDDDDLTVTRRVG
jgi:hypothetical protein